MSVAQRLYLLIVSAVVGLTSLASLGVVQADKVYIAANFANVNTVPSLLTLDDAATPFAQLRAKIWQYIALSDHAKKDELEQGMHAVSTSLSEQAATLMQALTVIKLKSTFGLVAVPPKDKAAPLKIVA